MAAAEKLNFSKALAARSEYELGSLRLLASVKGCSKAFSTERIFG
ncbi:MAG TPA: hypothetical protein VGP72_25735 [Planctomycetota bacterium]|jgi:hypothetical protein